MTGAPHYRRVCMLTGHVAPESSGAVEPLAAPEQPALETPTSSAGHHQ